MDTSRPQLTLVRHGQTEWSSSGKHTGRTDVPLTDLGRSQARALGGMLAGEEFETVLASPLQRAWETMELAGYGSQAAAEDGLMEWDYGDYEESVTAEVREEIPGWSVWTHPIPGGEAVDDVGRRADAVIDEVLSLGGPALLFAHGHYLRIFAARWMGLAAAHGSALALDTATVSRLGWERENRVVEAWNVACHLRSEDPRT